MRRGGLILLDNMLQGGRVLAPETESTRVIDELNPQIHADERVDVAMTMAADGLTFVRVPLDAGRLGRCEGQKRIDVVPRG